MRYFFQRPSLVCLLSAAVFLCSGVIVTCRAVQASLVEAEILHDLIREYRSAEIRNSTATSVGDVRGDARMNYSLLRRHLFLHPPSRGAAATATYRLALPRLRKREALAFTFAVGLRPGWREADKIGADGVIFRVLINDEEAFEQLWDRNGWCFSAVDLSPFAGEKVRLTLVCDKNKNSSADWAMWGDPRVLRIRLASSRLQSSPRADLFLFHASPSKEIDARWLALGPAAAGVIQPSPDAGKNFTAWFPAPTPTEGTPTLPSMRLSDGSEPKLERVSLVSYAPRLDLVSCGQSPTVVTPFDEFSIIATVTNAGEGTLEEGHDVRIRLGVPAGFRLVEGEIAEQSVSGLKPGDERDLTWRLFAPGRPREGEFALTMGVVILRVFNVSVLPRGQGTEYAASPSDADGYHQKENSVILEKGSVRLAFVRDAGRFLYGTILVKTDSRWKSVASLAPFASLSIQLRNGEGQDLNVYPDQCTQLKEFGAEALAEGEVAVRFSGDFLDEDSVKWNFQQSFALRNGSPWIEVQTSLAPNTERQVTLFMAPRVLVGDGSFGKSKNQAIFPGLEYLGENEPSSSTRDIAFPLSQRATPHPLRVTTPLMAVRNGSTIMGLSWDVHQKWHGDENMPTPIFSSPNRFPAQDNHLMALIVPTVPEFIQEGTLESIRPISLAADQTLKTSASILVLTDAPDITDAVVSWTAEHGLPEPRWPRTLQEEIQLCRHGFLRSVWDESAQGWSHCVGWVPGPYPGYCTLLNLDYLLSKDDSVRRTLRDRIDLIVRSCLDKYGGGSLWRRDACHILTGELPFLEGRVVESVSAWERATQGLLARQSPDGSWRWRPDTRRSVLGKPGDTTSGMCARGALEILREAIVTGNQTHIAAALKALKFLDKYTIPTGAQEWECPIYAPDVLAAAYAVRAFILAHEITGEDEYLRKAVFWARTGIPFHYLWDIGDEMPQMLYAGIPIFGATFFRHSWLGRPVQWCSLVYAYSLLRLSPYDDSFDWHRLAEGITVSAMWQQYAEGKSKGCYPDSWDLLENHPNPADINPENILLNSLTLKGYDPGLKHRVLNRSGSPVFITSIAEMLSAESEGDDGALVRLKFFPGVKSYLLIAGLPPRCKPEVTLNGRKLEVAQQIDGVRNGWFYLPERNWLVVAVTHSEKEDALRIRW